MSASVSICAGNVSSRLLFSCIDWATELSWSNWNCGQSCVCDIFWAGQAIYIWTPISRLLLVGVIIFPPSGLRLEKGVLTSRIFSLVPILARYTWQSSLLNLFSEFLSTRTSTGLSTTSRTGRAAVGAPSSSVRKFYRALGKWTVPWRSIFNCV